MLDIINNSDLLKLAVPALTFIGGMAVNAYSVIRRLATKRYVDDKFEYLQRSMEEKTALVLKDCITHSDRNRQAMFLEFKEAMIQVSSLSTKTDMILELIRQFQGRDHRTK